MSRIPPAAKAGQPPCASLPSVPNQLTSGGVRQSQGQRGLEFDKVVNTAEKHWAPSQTWLFREAAA